MKTKLSDKAKWFLNGIVVCFTCPSLLLVILASPQGMRNSLGILGRGCLNLGDAKITATAVRRALSHSETKSNVLYYLQCLTTVCISPRPKLDILLKPFGCKFHQEDTGQQQGIRMKLWNGVFLLLVIHGPAVIQSQHKGRWGDQLMSSFTGRVLNEIKLRFLRKETH